MVKVEYIGPREETFSLTSRVLRAKTYRFGNNQFHREQTVFQGDADWMLGMLNGDQPTFRILPTNGNMEVRDPAAALGMAVTR